MLPSTIVFIPWVVGLYNFFGKEVGGGINGYERVDRVKD